MNRTFRFILLIIILLVCWFFGRIFHFDIDYFRAFFSQYPLVLSGLFFITLYIGLTTLIWFGPKDVLRITSAILFGPYVSTVFVTVGEVGNAIILFYLSRHLGQGFIEQKFKLKSKQLDQIKKESGPWGVIALRVNPLVPLRMMDLAFGLSPIKFRNYFLAVLFVTPFRIFWLQYILAGVGEGIFKGPSVIMEYLLSNPFVFKYSVLYLLVVFILSIFAVIIKFLRKRIK